MLLARNSRKGFTLVEIMIVVAIIGILVSIATPGFINARKQSRAKACQESQEKLDGARALLDETILAADQGGFKRLKAGRPAAAQRLVQPHMVRAQAGAGGFHAVLR